MHGKRNNGWGRESAQGKGEKWVGGQNSVDSVDRFTGVPWTLAIENNFQVPTLYVPNVMYLGTYIPNLGT